MVSMSAQHSMKRMNSGTWMMMSEAIVENSEVKQTFQRYSLKELTVREQERAMKIRTVLISLSLSLSLSHRLVTKWA